jgi:hypothetical protein
VVDGSVAETTSGSVPTVDAPVPLAETPLQATRPAARSTATNIGARRTITVPA